MAGWGVGLGAFAQGFAGGIGLGQKFGEMNQKRQDREAINTINTEGKAAFDADVAAGKTTADKWSDHWTTNVLPKLTQTYIQQGNVEGATALQKWGESDAARRGTAAFGRILTASNFEDAGKAFSDLATTKGYLPSGFVLTGSEAVAGPNGQQGYKFTWRSPDGKAFSQQFNTLDDLRGAAAAALNPEAAAKMHLDRMNWGAEDRRKLGLYRAEKEIDQNPGLQPPPTGFRWNADRSALEPIPNGPAHPDYIGAKAGAEVRAKQGPQNNPYSAGGTFNEGQGKAAAFADRMAQADAVIGGLENINEGVSGWVGGMVNERLGDVAANQVNSPDRQKVVQAQRNFINAILRRESGAVISDSEFANARQQYFPQPGDSPEVIKQKRENRASAIRGLMREAGGSYKPPKGWEDPNSLPSYYAPKQAPAKEVAAGSGGQAASAPEPTDPGTGQPISSLPRPRNQQEYQSLPKGQRYVAPDGSVRVRQ